MSDQDQNSSHGVTGHRVSSFSEAEQFAHFTICRLPNGDSDCLGAGAMGITYRAYDRQLERYVALKVISPVHLHNPALRVRFLREAKAAARIQHPNIAHVLYQGEQNGACFYVMELISGESLESYVTRVGPLHPVHALQICHQVTLALDAAFKEQLLHRDLKPGNIMLTSYHDGRQHHVKVIDFGLAKFLSEAPGSFATMSGFLGTPSFASPEQCQEVEIDSRSDLYSLGATLWFILCGRSPFQGSTLSVIQAHVYDALPLEKLGEMPETVLNLLQKLLAKKPDDRPPTPLHAAYEIECAIEALGGNQAGAAPPPLKSSFIPEPSPSRSSSRKPILWTAAGLAALFLVAASAFFLTRSRPAPLKTSAPLPVTAVEIPSPTPTATPTLPPSAPTPTPEVTVSARPVEPAVPSPSSTPPPKEPPPGPPVFVNSLGMRFVDVEGLEGKISAWETRVKDYAAFVKETGDPGFEQGPPGSPKWDQPGFVQTPEDPVVFVNYEDALRFCRWLTQHERREGTLSKTQAYRLMEPFEADMSTGIRQGNKGKNPPDSGFFWGQNFPPQDNTGNFADLSAFENKAVTKHIENYRDGHATTAPVGTYAPNRYGIYDMAGNVSELIVIQQGREGQIYKFGGGWTGSEPYVFDPRYKEGMTSIQREPDLGFRCFLSEENKINRPTGNDRPGGGQPR